MGIDRIGKGGSGLPGSPSTESLVEIERRSSSAGVAPFSPQASAAVQGSPAVEVDPSSALERLRSGSLTLDGYLDFKVDEATSQLALPPVELNAVRAVLRERLASDPTLVALVRSATGAAAPRADEG